jgi:hypothetical protein
MNMSDPDGKQLVGPTIGVNFKIPVQYWYPTILAVITFTAGGVWWFHEQISPLETRIAKLEGARPGYEFPHRLAELSDDPDQKIIFLNNLSLNGPLSTRNEKDINDLVFRLTNQRRDLVLIITGFVGRGRRTGRAEDMQASEAVAERMKELLVARGLTSDRIFSRGYGQDVPDSFGSKAPLNVALLPCNIIMLMTRGAHV